MRHHLLLGVLDSLEGELQGDYFQLKHQKEVFFPELLQSLRQHLGDCYYRHLRLQM
jgi:hypothetical protein